MKSFNENVWELMKKVPRGRVTTYGLIARKLNSKAYRAVGNACRANPFAPRVPCHRVVRSDGSVGGFAGKTTGPTVTRKIRMLKSEHVKIQKGRVTNFDKVVYRF